MNKQNLLKFAEFLEDYDGNFGLNDFNLMKSILEKCGFERKAREGWYEFSEKIFYLGCLTDGWDWCFHWDWMKTDPSAIGCAARIRILVSKGCPKNWRKQIWGKAPLSYNLEDLKLIKEIEEVFK